MITVPNQPLGFNRVVDCNIDEGSFILFVQDGDVTTFQFQIEPCNGEPSVIRNGNFTEDGGIGTGWIRTPSASWQFQPWLGNVYHIPSTLAGNVNQPMFVNDGVLMLVTATIVQTQGTCSISMGGGGGVSWIQSFSGTVNSTFQWWVIAGDVQYLRVSASFASDATFGTLSAFVYNTDFNAQLVDLNDNVIDNNLPYTIYNGWATFTVNWEALGIDFGCYRIRVADPCECGQLGIVPLDLYTGLLPSAVNPWAWVVDDSFNLSGAGTALYIATGIPDTSAMLLSNPPYCVDREYTVSFVVASASNAEIRVNIGGTTGTWVSANGFFSEAITPTVSGALVIQARATGGGGVIELNSLSVLASSVEYAYESEPIKYIRADYCESHLIQICNDTDAMEMGFDGTGFAPNVRVVSSLRGSGYGSERNKYINSIGRSQTYYGRSRKLFALGLEVPEYVHDFIRLAVIADHLYIDGAEYFFEAVEYPTMALNDFDDLSGVSLPLSLKAENIMNRRLNSVVKGCAEVTSEIHIDGGKAPIPTGLETSTNEQITTG